MYLVPWTITYTFTRECRYTAPYCCHWRSKGHHHACGASRPGVLGRTSLTASPWPRVDGKHAKLSNPDGVQVLQHPTRIGVVCCWLSKRGPCNAPRGPARRASRPNSPGRSDAFAHCAKHRGWLNPGSVAVLDSHGHLPLRVVGVHVGQALQEWRGLEKPSDVRGWVAAFGPGNAWVRAWRDRNLAVSSCRRHRHA